MCILRHEVETEFCESRRQGTVLWHFTLEYILRRLRYLFTLFSPLSRQTDEQEVINFLLNTEIIPLCLRIMESGSELSKTVSFYSSSPGSKPLFTAKAIDYLYIISMHLRESVYQVKTKQKTPTNVC